MPAPLETAGPVRQDDRRRVAVVTTTIRVPRFLAEVLENARRHGHAEQVSFVVVGDRKTPPEAGEFLAGLAREQGATVTYLDLPGQRRLLRRWPALDLLLREDCVQRRNVGYLQAALDGAEVIIAMDDDNFPTEDDFLGHHLAVGREVEVPLVSHPSGWWNVCDRLLSDPPRRFYHRGFPKSQQWAAGDCDVRMGRVRAVMNAGLWLGAPDVDATAHLEGPIRVVGMQPIAGRRTCGLAPGTWCPANSQNTAFDISLLSAMYLPVMLDRVRGQRIDRMDDIWMSLFVRALADPRGEAVLCGPPLVRQDRNPHDPLADLAKELPGYFLTERIAAYLREYRGMRPDATAGSPSAAGYLDGYLDLVYHLRQSAEADPQIEEPDREYVRQLTLGMAVWHGVVKDLWGS